MYIIIIIIIFIITNDGAATFRAQDPTELTFANTLLLSNAAVSLCCAFVALETSNQYMIFPTGLDVCVPKIPGSPFPEKRTQRYVLTPLGATC